jgi:hypothetical protein
LPKIFVHFVFKSLDRKDTYFINVEGIASS